MSHVDQLLAHVPDPWRPWIPISALTRVAEFLSLQAEFGAAVQPAPDRMFRALALTAPEDVRVVILGQDPYPGAGVPTGLAFDVGPDAPVPPSLKNLLTELTADTGVPAPGHGDLTAWAERGVLLLNTTLTVTSGDAGSHAHCGWKDVTEALLSALARHRDDLVFLCMGRHAQRAVARLALTSRQRVVNVAHPSPLSVRHFRGSQPFAQVNAALADLRQPPIDWSL